MTLNEIKELLQAEVITGKDKLDIEITFAGGSDLMSDVLAFGKPGILLLTGLSNAQSVRTANIIDAKAIGAKSQIRKESNSPRNREFHSSRPSS
jgi:hypothetical protein